MPAGRAKRKTTAMLGAELPVACVVVLVVDDDERVRRVVGQLLRHSGFDVIEAHDGVDALEVMRTFRPDVILTDLDMPRCDGERLCEHVRGDESTASIPVVLLTGECVDQEQFHDAGFTAIVRKPAPSSLPNVISAAVLSAERRSRAEVLERS